MKPQAGSRSEREDDVALGKNTGHAQPDTTPCDHKQDRARCGHGESCPDCGGAWHPESGCWVCKDCGYSNCE
jgi:hypothetical protein